MIRKSLVLAFTLLVSLSVFAADPKMSVAPATGEGDAAEMAKNLSKEFKILYKTVKGAKLSDVDSASAGKFRKCAGKLKCAKDEAKKIKKSQYLLFPVVKTTDEGFSAILYILDKNGKLVKKQNVDVAGDTDAEDFASEVAAKLMDAIANMTEGGEEGDDEEEPAPKEEAPKLTDREKKEVLRAGFKAYKAGKGKEASNLFRKAENLSLADTVDEIVQAVEDAKTMTKNGDASKAVDTVNKVEKKDFDLREKGYKELQFIKETNKKRKYNEPGKDDYDKARRTFKSVKQDMKTISVWRDGEMKKLEDSMAGKLDEQKRLADKFEEDEKKQEKAEKKQEKDHQKKIETLRESIENLDATYRDRLKKTDKEIEKLNKQLEDDRPAEEMYKKEIEEEIAAIESKYKQGSKDLKKQLLQAKKQAKTDGEAAEKEYNDKLQALEKSNSDLEKQVKKLTREVEKMESEFEATEQKEAEKFDKSIAAAEAQDSKDLEAAEKKADEETENLNKQLEDYDKKISAYSEKADKIDSEISDFSDKQEEKLSKNQEKFDKKREDAERKFESERGAAEEKAEQAYGKEQAARAKKVETLESQMFEIQDKVENYEKNPQWQKLKKDAAAASKDLAKFEDGHDKFIEKETASASKNYKAELAKIDADQKSANADIKKETAAFKTKKESEKKALAADMKKAEQEKSAFEKDIKKKQATINANKNKKIKEIEGRAAKREAERTSKAKQRKAAYDKNAAEKRKQLAALEKQLDAANANSEKTRDTLAQQLENKKAASEKKVNDLEIALEQKKEANENAIEKEKQAVYAKYEKKAETDKKAITAKIAQLENSSKTFIAQRGKEEAKLRADLEAAEKKTDTMKAGWEKDAAKRKAAYESNLKAAEKREAAAKTKYEQSKNSIEKQYKAKVDALIKEKSISFSTGSEFKEERDRSYEFSAYTKQLNAVKADALAAQGMEKLRDEEIAEARKFFFDALYTDANSKSAQNGLAEIEKTAAAMFDRAYADVQAGDISSAKKVLIKLRKELSPKSAYYLRVLALIEDTKEGGDSSED
jgi:hypothetical protein